MPVSKIRGVNINWQVVGTQRDWTDWTDAPVLTLASDDAIPSIPRKGA